METLVTSKAWRSSARYCPMTPQDVGVDLRADGNGTVKMALLSDSELNGSERRANACNSVRCPRHTLCAEPLCRPTLAYAFHRRSLVLVVTTSAIAPIEREAFTDLLELPRNTATAVRFFR
jgi:hypothetical protein